MDSLQRQRSAAKTWVTREVNRLKTVLSTQNPSIVSVQQNLESLEVRLSKLDNIQTEIELIIDESELESDIRELDIFLNSSREVKETASNYLQATQRAAYVDSDGCGIDGPGSHRAVNDRLSATSHAHQQANLPKIQISKFDGNYANWPEFWDKFSALIDQTAIPTISKFSYLQSYLIDEAFRTIKGLSLTEANYQTAISLLKERFGKRERIIHTHIQKLLTLDVPNVRAVSKLWEVYNELQSNIRSLENLDISGEQYGVILTPIVLSRMPQEFRMEWARDSEDKPGDLASLMEFMRKEITLRERSETFQQPRQHVVNARTEQHHGQRRVPSAAVLQSSNRSGSSHHNNTCSFCGKRHRTELCWDIRNLPVEEIKRRIIACNLCFRCLNDKHHARSCTKLCEMCSGRHHKLICYRATRSPVRDHDSKTDMNPCPITSTSGSHSNEISGELPVKTDSVTTNFYTSEISNRATLMQTVSTRVNGIQCTCLFDSGSDKSFVTTDFVKKAKLKYVGREHIAQVCFGEKGPRNRTTRNVFEIKFHSGVGNQGINVTEMPTITPPMFRSKIPDHLLQEFDGKGPDFRKQRLHESKSISIDVLIGLDHFWDLMTSKIIQGSDGLVAQETKLGWILSGSYHSPDNNRPESTVKRQNLCLTELSDAGVRRFWEIESLGIVNDEMGCNETLEKFNESVRFVGDRYEVDLPWVENKRALLVDNYHQAHERLERLERKLGRDADLKEKYESVFAELEISGVIEEVPVEEICVNDNRPVFYLPHRPVIKEASVSTKVRPVFDASAVGPTGVSLNACMHTGPNLTGKLLDVLLRFRRWRCAVSSDIEKAFLQIQVNCLDRDVHRFLLRQGNCTRVMRITRVPFGNTASPFLLNATIKYHLSKRVSSKVVEELDTNLYVDDWLTGADSAVEAKALKEGATAIMSEAGMNMTKWCSNEVSVADQEVQILRDKDSEADQHKVLGVVWSPTEDQFTFVGSTDDIDFRNMVVTRRVVLSCISRIFDPIGFLQPFVMVAKMIFQGLWKLGSQWDDRVPVEEENKFLRWADDMRRINEFSVPRCYVNLSWGHKQCIELHAFSDASEKAYGSCIYMKITEEDGSVTSSLVIAKAKLAPVKRITLPRLELLGTLLSARLLSYVKKALVLPESTRYRCWTDSTVALRWIQSDANRWKTFVANRVTEIQQLTSPDSWRHCPGSDNPADILSRGVMIDSLLNSTFWLHGPTWLNTMDEMHIGSQNPIMTETETGHTDCDSDALTEERKVCSIQLTVEKKNDPIFPVERWGEFSKAVRICAYVLRFVCNLKASLKQSSFSRETIDLTTEEMRQAYVKLLAETQSQYFETEIADIKSGKSVNRSSPLFKMKPFFDTDGLLRMKGRLQCSSLSYDEKHPVILPKCHISMLIVRREHKVLSHAGVSQVIASLRNKFWIISLRSIVKGEKRQCVVCSRHDSVLPCQEPSPIPRRRLERSNPFSVVGIDYAGPLFTSDFVGKKFYILLFTCAVIRAVHIELVDSLSLSDFLLAFRRFVARRGMCSIIISDNAKTFKAAAKELAEMFADQSPKWDFITPRAPWCGGFWERLIKSIKLCLKKTLGLRCITRCELETTLHQIEACINSRPLTVVHDDMDSNEPLTPSSFLLGRSDGHRPLTDFSVSPRESSGHDLRQMFRTKNVQLNHFWERWQSEYIRHLPLVKHSRVNRMVEKGTLCVIKEDNMSRMYWPLGRIVDTFPGRDGVIRTVRIKTAKGCFNRPLNKVCCLEVLDDPQCVDEEIRNDDMSKGRQEEIVKDPKEKKQNNVDPPLYMTRSGRMVRPTPRLT